MAYNFAEESLRPHAAKWDEEKIFPLDVIRSTAELGFGGLTVSEDYGGVDLGRLESSLVFEALSTGCISTSAYLSIHNMCARMIDTYGSEVMK